VVVDPDTELDFLQFWRLVLIVSCYSGGIGFGAHCWEETLRLPSTALISAVCFLTDALQGHAPFARANWQ
jgi:hypothetical protein